MSAVAPFVLHAPTATAIPLVLWHGRPAERRHSLQIELNRRLYMDEETLDPNADYQHLQGDLERLIGASADYVRARSDAGKRCTGWDAIRDIHVQTELVRPLDRFRWCC